MIWLYIGIPLVTILGIIIILKIAKNTRARTPVALAEQIIRFPERILLDIPLFIASIPTKDVINFLQETDNEIAQRGKFKMRRTFLQILTTLFENPSINTLKDITNFLFADSTKDFQTTLRWDGRCNSALMFLTFMKIMCKSIESYRSPGVIRKNFPYDPEELNRTAENTLSGADREIAREWKRLLAAFYMKTDQQKKDNKKSNKSKRAKKRKDKSKKLLPESLLSEKKIPVSLDNQDLAPHLLHFQTVARDVLMQYRQKYNEQ